MAMHFFLISGYAFWIIVAVVAALDVFFLSIEDTEPQAIGLSFGMLSVAYLFSDAFTDVKVSILLITIFGYFAIGTFWSIWKWYSFVVNSKAKLKEKYDYKINNGIIKKEETFVDYCKDSKPLASDNKQKIFGWLSLWPFSLTWWIMTWPRRAATWLYNRLSTLYDRISTHVWNS